MNSFFNQYGGILLAIICAAIILAVINPVLSEVSTKIDAILSLLM